jgi:hypothetical protein
MMYAEKDRVGRTLEEANPNSVVNAGREEIIVIPLVATELGFRQALGNPHPSPYRGSFQHRSTRVEFVIVADEIGSRANERARLAEPLDPSSTLVEDTITGTDSTDIVHNGLQRRRP